MRVPPWWDSPRTRQDLGYRRCSPPAPPVSISTTSKVRAPTPARGRAHSPCLQPGPSTSGGAMGGQGSSGMKQNVLRNGCVAQGARGQARLTPGLHGTQSHLPHLPSRAQVLSSGKHASTPRPRPTGSAGRPLAVSMAHGRWRHVD